MTRRKSTGLAGDLMELVARLPWGVGVALAVVSYLLLHHVASQSNTVVPQPGQITAVMTQAVWHAFAFFAQYALPFLCLVGAAASAWRRKQRKALVSDVVNSRAADMLDGITWREFEMLVGEGFRLQGFKVVETGGGGADGGIDLVLSRPGQNGSEKYLVQCKQWRAYKVGVDVVRGLYGVMAAKGAAGGFVVTSGRFTDEAKDFASGRNVLLVDGPQLHALLSRARAGSGAAFADLATSPDNEPASALACPTCAKPMIRRTAKRGASAGREFWGCTGYPSCRGTRPIA